MEFRYSNLTIQDLRHRTLADLVVNIEADFQIIESDKVLYTEQSFPVYELARQLTLWGRAEEDALDDFTFDSMSFEDPGAVQVARSGDAWVVFSGFTPGVTSSSLSLDRIRGAVQRFSAQLRAELDSLGVFAPDI